MSCSLSTVIKITIVYIIGSIVILIINISNILNFSHCWLLLTTTKSVDGGDDDDVTMTTA